MSGLTRDDIDQILKLIDGSDFDHLKLEMGDVKLELRKSGTLQPAVSTDTVEPVAVVAPPSASSAVSADSATAAASLPLASATTENNASQDNAAVAKDIPAPLLGTFYHAAGPGSEPFVAIGDTVSPDSVIGIIEVMKLMNQVQAGVSGKVTQIVAPDGELVEHGQTLIRVLTD